MVRVTDGGWLCRKLAGDTRDTPYNNNNSRYQLILTCSSSRSLNTRLRQLLMCRTEATTCCRHSHGGWWRRWSPEILHNLTKLEKQGKEQKTYWYGLRPMSCGCPWLLSDVLSPETRKTRLWVLFTALAEKPSRKRTREGRKEELRCTNRPLLCWSPEGESLEGETHKDFAGREQENRDDRRQEQGITGTVTEVRRRAGKCAGVALVARKKKEMSDLILIDPEFESIEHTGK